MNRRSFLAALAATPTLAALAAACGDDSKRPPLSIPDDPLDFVLKITYEGGFVPAGSAFVNLPAILISGDGRVFTPGVAPAIFPGPLLPSLFERTITNEGVANVAQLAEDAGLLAVPLDYSLPDDIGIADAPDTVVAISVNGKLYEHRAYALGIDGSGGGGGGSTAARDNLYAFVTRVSDIAKVAGVGNLGPERPFAPEQYRFQALAVDPTQFTDPSPTIVDWPQGTGASLAAAAECATVAAVGVDDLFSTATQLTFFAEDDVVYQLSVVGVLPGDAVCPTVGLTI
ncbi:MAG: hypothetical protein HY826_07820 [Actinobacteria bacterium]|nr:hypothetical protein [Actinomycetota bacterium]